MGPGERDRVLRDDKLGTRKQVGYWAAFSREEKMGAGCGCEDNLEQDSPQPAHVGPRVARPRAWLGVASSGHRN